MLANRPARFTLKTALIASLGGFLMGFDASVISGVNPFIETEFALTRLQLGWAVASLTLAATLAMGVAGPLSDRYGRRRILQGAAILFLLSAVWSALAPDYPSLVAARMLGGLGVGAALIIAPVYIAELAPAAARGRLVSLNQLNIVIGISAAFLANYLILQVAAVQSWRWMLGVEAIPALLYFGSLLRVPESPRWLLMRGQEERALAVMSQVSGPQAAQAELASVRQNLAAATAGRLQAQLRQLLQPRLRRALFIGLGVALVQQLTGINAIFFYAPTIFAQAGAGLDAAFLQAVAVGLTNLLFTLLAIGLIDRLGRRFLLNLGLAGAVLSLGLLAWNFSAANYMLDMQNLTGIPETLQTALLPLHGELFADDRAFRAALFAVAGAEPVAAYETTLISQSIQINAPLTLFAILGFVASFAISVGPVMWVLLAEIFSNAVRGVAISIAGLVNSAASFLVQLIFPWQLAALGNANTFLLYGLFSLAGLLILSRTLPETKGKSLEEIEVLWAK
ncbi:MAG: sugar porter family MFS transporter [Cellvibrionales bacterium]|nr:sugar porter family MFS transporter [Cellvibrionales bacterium]